MSGLATPGVLPAAVALPAAGRGHADAPSARALAAWQWLEQRVDAAFGARANPLRQLGSLGFMAFWLLALTGIWLYAVLDTSASGAYASIDALSRSPAAVVRSLHRYAADAFVIFTALHLLREVLHGRYRAFRRFSWLTGMATLPLIAVAAIGGFWLHWDQLGQFSAIASAEWLDALPLLAQPLARNFVGAAQVSDRLFSLLVFVHIGVPLLLVFALWFHIQRITGAAVFPARRLAFGTLATLVVLALAQPVRGAGPADLATQAPVLAYDWIVLALHPLMYATSAGATWALLGGAFVALALLPFWPARGRVRPTALAPDPGRLREVAARQAIAAPAPIAVVDPANCNGCRRCFADCPYAAITMAPHPSGRAGRQIAVVDADLCAGCAICVGACPSSTPFRSVERLVTGIDMPGQTIGVLREQLRDALQACAAARPIVVFDCAEGAGADGLADADLVRLPLICAGQLPPSFVEYALRDGAAGVVVAGCHDGGCAWRLGARWTAERLAGAREPHLRASVPVERLRLVAADRGQQPTLAAAVDALRVALAALPAPLAEPIHPHPHPKAGAPSAPVQEARLG